jgi:ribosomal protein S18 acetylase RimI-like enzyme
MANSLAWRGFSAAREKKIRHRGEIWGVYISEDNRGKGVGRVLLTTLIGLVERVPGMQQIALGVSSQNARAKALYESLGFEIYGCEKRALNICDEYVDEELMVLYFKT